MPYAPTNACRTASGIAAGFRVARSTNAQRLDARMSGLSMLLPPSSARAITVARGGFFGNLLAQYAA